MSLFDGEISEAKTSATCETIDVRAFTYGIDANGDYLEEYRDIPCIAPACGTTEDGLRVCAPCGVRFEQEDFVVFWDPEEST